MVKDSSSVGMPSPLLVPLYLQVHDKSRIRQDVHKMCPLARVSEVAQGDCGRLWFHTAAQGGRTGSLLRKVGCTFSGA